MVLKEVKKRMNKADMVYDLSLIWSTARDVFPYFGKLDFNFDELYLSYLNRVIANDDEKVFHELLKEFVSKLNDGHTKYYPPEKYSEKQAFIPPEKPSYKREDGVLTISLHDFFNDYSGFVKQCLNDNEGVSLVRIDVSDNIGGNTYYAAKVAELFISGVFHGCQKWTQIHKANDMAAASQVARMNRKIIEKYIRDGLMNEENVKNDLKLINHQNYEEYIDTYGSRDHKAMYEGPLELLISKGTMSAAEDFTAMFKSSKRAVLVGEATYGSTGSPYVIDLKCGGRVQIVSVGYRLLDGTEFIGIGIQPDRKE